ncbi:DNA-binding phosphoprotein [Sea otter poxvirus]|uniref:DNA-binding phosphoprotein n=1 Tax=Sea otter poxvirus TaxID=1416741 RepID=A0A2U9QHJ2_9POXV|nr:DNA-binding phosphoprotein [Sea otter poxvirus]AWU47069.1 DNA-binding phosphoprotein [Sea otter poxvirus]
MTEISRSPFYIDTERGKILVLKWLTVCQIPEISCSNQKTCSVKTDVSAQKHEQVTTQCQQKAQSPQQESTHCPFTTTNSNTVPFMRTNMLETLFTNNKNNAARILG